MKRPALILLAGLAGAAQANGFENFLNPMAMMSAPFGGGYGSNPFAANPFGGYGNPFGGYGGGFGGNPFGGNPFGGNPFSNNPLGGLGALGGLGGLAAPLALGLINPMGMGNVTYPAMQMAPNMMSYSHYNQMGNPYGGLFGGGNPYMQRGLPNPFTPPAFSPSVPTLPFSSSQGTLPALPFLPQGQPQPQAQPAYGGYGGYGGYSGMGGLGGLGGFGGGNPFAGLAPMPSSPFQQQPPAALPPGSFPTPYGLTPSQPSSAPAPAPAPSQAAQAFPGGSGGMMPFPFPFLPQVPAATAPAAPAAPPQAAPAPAAAPTPLDPAVFLQMFMRPVEAAVKAAPAEAPKPAEPAAAEAAKPEAPKAEAVKPAAVKPEAAK